MPKLEDYLKIIGDDRFEITEIRAEEECIVTLDELKSIITKSSEIEAHPICNEEQKYCVCCILEGKVVAFDVRNRTKDVKFLDFYFNDEIHDYNDLMSLLQKEKVFPAGIIDGDYRKRFNVESDLVVASDLIYVNDNAYPYKIYKEKFSYFRYDYSFETFGACDNCLYIYFKDNTSVKVCIADYSK